MHCSSVQCRPYSCTAFSVFLKHPGLTTQAWLCSQAFSLRAVTLNAKHFLFFFLTFLITPVLFLSLVVNILVTNPCRPFCIYSKSDAVFPTRGTAAMNWSFSLTFVLKTFRFTGIKVIFPQAVPRLLRRLALLKETRRTQKECLYLM